MAGSGSRSKCVFLQLKDAIASNRRRVSLFAIVRDIGRARKSKGTDYVCTLHIMDESFQAGIPVNFFANFRANLPRVRSTGDIIRLDDVEIQFHDKDVYAVCKKSASSFALFKGESNSFDPYQVSSRFRSLDHNNAFITELRAWWDGYRLDTGVDGYALLLREMKEASYFDLVCKVCHVVEVSEIETILFVWDGTDAPPAPADAKMNYDLQALNPLPLQLEDFCLPKSILSAFPPLGSILGLTSGEDFKDLWGQLRGTGRWVKFRNIQCHLQSGLWKVAMLPSSRVCFLSNNATSAIRQVRLYNERVSAPLAGMPDSCPSVPSHITVTDCENLMFSTLRTTVIYSGHKHRFKCVVRVVESYPFRAENFLSDAEPHVYRIRLTLEDPTARIHAFIMREDGVKFFGGYLPTDILASKMKKLLGTSESNLEGEDVAATSRNAPWVQCCIVSFLNRSGNRKYRIVDTALVI